MARGRAGDFDITRNIRIIEWLKSEMLNSVAKVFSLLAGGAKSSQEALIGYLGDIIVACYLLAKRLGIHYALLDQTIEDQIRLGIIEGSDIEKSYGDLSELQRHLRESRRNP
ncbi:MAG: MazG-like family protein [Caldicoprobacterales bacterium]